MTDTAPTSETPGPAEAGAGSRAASTAAKRPRIGWPRAIATGLVVLIIGFAGAILGPNAILTKSLALTRTAREWLAIALFFTVIIVLAVALRWLQHRKLL